MFPNMRLMIATTLASVAALICGFGLFAAVHVRHEPLARVSPAAVALRLKGGGNVVALPVMTMVPFNDALRTGATESAGGVSTLAFSGAAPNEPTGTQTVAPSDDQQAGAAAEPAPASPPEAAIAETAPPQKPDEATESGSAQAPASAPSLADAAPPGAAALVADLPVESHEPVAATQATELTLATPTAEPVKAQSQHAVKAAEKRHKRTRLAKVHRLHRTRAIARNSPPPQPVYPSTSGIGGPFISATSR
jgi:hypothetical protein